MKRISIGISVMACLAFSGITALAEELEAIDADGARRIAERLSREAAKIENPQVKIAADFDKAQGVHRPPEAGVLIVPRKDLREGGNDDSDAVKKETGDALGIESRKVPNPGDLPPDRAGNTDRQGTQPRSGLRGA